MLKDSFYDGTCFLRTTRFTSRQFLITIEIHDIRVVIYKNSKAKPRNALCKTEVCDT